MIYILLIYMVIMTYFDIRKKSIPTWISLLCGVLLLTLELVFHEIPYLSAIGGMAVGALLWVISLMTHEAIGKGDALVFVIVGIAEGFTQTLTILLFSLVAAALFSIVMLIVKRVNRKTTIPFIPFIMISLMGVFLYG